MHSTPLAEILAPYVPGLTLERLARDPAPLHAPQAEHARCALLFADMSGFTPLAERLSGRGAAGAEELNAILNACFARLIDVIGEHGGDIVRFAGDALLATWRAREGDESLAYATQRAASCALAVQRTLAGFEPAEKAALGLRVAIGAGPLSFMHLGGVLDRWEFLIAGDPLEQVGNASGAISPGQVALSPQAAELLAPLARVEHAQGIARLMAIERPTRPAAAPRPKATPEMEAALRTCLPSPSLHRIVAGQDQWLADLRRVTVLFVNLPELRGDAPLERAQEVVRALQTALYRLEGSLVQLGVDDKGVSLIAALGLPPMAHEDDPARGVRAALELHRASRELGLTSSIGVATGRVFCGTVGNAVRREYALVGLWVNMAARLMQAAAGDILCDDATREGCGEGVEWEAPRTIQVKGRSVPVTVHRPLRRVQRKALARGKSGAMIGREHERTRLRAALDSLVQRGTSHLIAVEGEPGIGKTRLLEDLWPALEAAGATALFGAADAVERSTPYHAWQAVFSKRLGLDELVELEARRERVLQQLTMGHDLVRLAPLLNAILHLELEESAFTAQLTRRVRAANTRELVVAILQLSASLTPLVIVLDDIHWLDSASWELLLAVSREVHPLLVLVLTRPFGQDAPAEYRQLVHAPNAEVIRLEKMLPEEALELATRRLGVERLPERAAAFVAERADGHPFIAEELAHALRDAGVIVIEGTRCTLAPGVGELSAIDLPGSVEGIITSRIDRLTTRQQLTVKAAAVIGLEFDLDVLAGIFPVVEDKPRIADELRVLERVDLTRRDGLTASGGEHYAFKHVITQEVAHGLLPYVQRAELHRRVAQWYEQEHTGDLALQYPLLAHHWSLAGVEARAVDYFQKAAEVALDGHANAEVIEFLHEACERDARCASASSAKRRAHWEHMLGEAEEARGDAVAAVAHLERALVLLGFPPPSSGARLALAILRLVLRRLLPTRTARSDDEHEQERLLAAASALERLFLFHYLADDTARLVHVTLLANELARAVGRVTAVLSRSHACLAALSAAIPWHGEARRSGALAIATARELEHIPSLTWALLCVATYEGGIGEWQRSEDKFHQGIALAQRLGDGRLWAEHTGSLGIGTAVRGRFLESTRLYAEVEEESLRRGDEQTHAWGLLGRVRSLWLLGHIDELRALLPACDELVARRGERIDLLNRLDHLGVSALLALADSDEARAQEHVADAVARMRRTGRPSQWIVLPPASLVVDAALELLRRRAGTPDAAHCARLARHSLRFLCRLARIFPVGAPRAWHARGQLASLQGRTRVAIGWFAKSLRRAEALRLAFDEGRAALALARHLGAGDARRAELQERGSERLRECGVATAPG